MKRATAITLAGSLVALLLGALAGSSRGPIVSQNKSTASSAPAADRAAAMEHSRPTHDPLAEALKTETGAKRWLLLVCAAEKATALDMPGLIRIAGNDSAAVRMLAARWAELDPHHMFNRLYIDALLREGDPGALPERYILNQVLFDHWIKVDLSGAIKALNDVPDFSGRESLRMSTANTLMKTDVEQGLQAMKDWNIRNYIPDMKKVAEWAARDPQRAAESVLKVGNDYAANEALKQVGKAWGDSDPKGGLRFAATLLPGTRATLGAEIIKRWAEKDVVGAAAFAAEQSDASFRASLAQGLASTWGKTDPAAALAWSEQNLRGAARTETIAGLIKAASEKSLTTASELVSDMEPGAAQNRACASIFETWFNKGKGERDAAFEWLASLPDSAARKAALERVQWDWMWRDPEGVRDFIAGPHGDLASDSMIHQVARNQAARNPEAAMQWAASLPAERAKDAHRAVFESWVSVRPDGAADYARKLPTGVDRDQAIRTVSQTLIFQAPQQAVEWFRSLPAADQKLVREIFDHSSLPDAQRQKLNDALAKP